MGEIKKWHVFVLGVLLVVAAALAGFAINSQAKDSKDAQQAAEDYAPELQQRVEDRQADREAREEAEYEASVIRLDQPDGRALEIFLAADSLGAGYFATSVEDAYRSRVQAGLNDRGVSTNVTLATKPVEDDLFQITTVEPVPQMTIDLAIIELGTNDVGRTERPEFEEEYQSLIDEVRTQNADAPVMCLGVWGQPNSERQSYDTIIRQVCEENDGRYVSLSNAYARGDTVGPEGLDTWAGPSDDFHPNDLGHELIADLILERLPED
ncbi:SGNH/GDSL hydrolase family protein [Nesterenkonia jeotgali]|uniref:SGNH hydrolase-type esterase domain-containing protein n=1 Tax=Nesterenkonia jeotgali TaxID=317018 RepID=A0A0W8ICW7_9MICC|nr:SGNH/GDSL hydrolase family protein [Nesterenkonia jeotgali]KUG57767.1 hypothetical protein AVL63_04390 [Nesterenkonia jeotgali]